MSRHCVILKARYVEMCNNKNVEKNKGIPMKSVAVAAPEVQMCNAGALQSLGNLLVIMFRGKDGQCFFFKVPAF